MKPIRRSEKQHPFALWLLKGLLFILGIAALFPGIEMIRHPSGKGLGFPEGSLDRTPFTSYLIPGFLLTVFVGGLSLFAWYALWKRPELDVLQTLNPFPKKHWAWTLALVAGCSLIIWILVQMTMVPFFFLQPTLLVWGIGIVLLCLMPKVHAWYE